MLQPEVQPSAEPSARPARFVLRRLIAVLVALALVAAGIAAPVDWIRSLTTLVLFVASPGALTAAIIYGRGYARAFSIGGMFHYWAFWSCCVGDVWDKLAGISLPNDDQLKTAILTGVGIAFVLVGGLIAVGVRWLVGGTGSRAGIPARPAETRATVPPAHLQLADAHALARIDAAAAAPIAEHRPFQFSLRTMFIVTTLVAVVCSGLFAPVTYIVVATIAGLIVLAAVALTVAIIYARGYLRTFCVGAIFPASMVFVVLVLACMFYFTTITPGSPVSLSDSDSTFDATDQATREGIALYVACYLAFCFVSGLVAMGVRWMIESPHRPRRPHVHWDPLKAVRESAVDEAMLELEEYAVEAAGST